MTVPGPALVVSIHDVAPATAVPVRRWVTDLDRLGVPATLLVVPGPWRGPGLAEAPDLAGWLRDRRAIGDEIAQHGWDHRAVPGSPNWRRSLGSALARGCEEFWTVDEEAAARRLCRGREVLAEAGLVVDGFTPPGWLASPGTVRALRHLGYRYTTSHTAITDLPSGRRLNLVALSQRPGGAGEQAGAVLMAVAARPLVRHGQGVRIALHPDDLDRPGLREATVRAIGAALDAGAQPLTYLDLVERRASPPAEVLC